MNGQILLITDGSPSADAAVQMATELSLGLKQPLRAVFILDEGWKNFLGDEWINTSSTRMKFFHWFEDGLHKHSEDVLAEVAEKVKEKGGQVETEIKVGKTEKVIVELTAEQETALLVLPNPHATAPAATAGLRYNLNSLSKKVKCPIYIGPQ
ncbi:universal stress protein [Desulfosporosinus youngiae]|uniref:Universal stress family protein n=1 Tax=Desulfosporosinus youngiae DSM 17734 TaxID=768710 RepID=H5XY60_9FIRM|nr:universal stress protein [Desulfosporosinus youngiae]EHQ91270.1 universal stress family protein [Desulfosporosinus youngiae DSM 17734]